MLVSGALTRRPLECRVVSEIDTREGAEVAVLYSVSNPKQFAVYTPGLGMTVGLVS